MIRRDFAVDMFTIDTTHGTIHYDENIVRKIISRGVEEFDGKVLLYNNTKRIPGLPSGRSKSGNLQTGGANTVKIEETDLGTQITVYIVVKFGMSINEATNGLIDYIYEYMEKIMRISPVRVTVIVTGVLSKNLVRRNIEVSR